MALPTKAEIVTLNWSKNVLPWCKVPARSDIDVTGMDWIKSGLPWVVGLGSEGGGGDQSISAAGNIASAATLGTANLAPGPITLYFPGIPASEAWGLPQVGSGSATLFPQGIPAAEACGLPIMVPGSLTFYPASIPSAAAFGFPALFRGQTLIPQKVSLTVDYRRLEATPGWRRLATTALTTRLQVTPDA